MVEYSSTSTAARLLSNAQPLKLSWLGEHTGNALAKRERAAGLASLPDCLQHSVRRGRCPAAARLRASARLLRDPGEALRVARPGAADEPAGQIGRASCRERVEISVVAL